MFIYVISFFIILLDRLTKFCALKYLSPSESVSIVPNVFHLTLVKNPGIAFGLFGNRSSVLFVVILSCLAVLIWLSLEMRKAAFIQRLSIAFILGGAGGNLIDRILFGHVIDFFDFRVWPVFNVADSFITVGVAMFLLASFQKPKIS